MIKGYVYLSILENDNKRVAGIRFTDHKLDKSITMTTEIDRSIPKSVAYVEMLNTTLMTYIKLVSDKSWVKYDKLIIMVDKNSRCNLDMKIDPATLVRYEHLIKIIGDVKIKIIKVEDNDYILLLGSINEKLKSLELKSDDKKEEVDTNV